MKNPFAAMAVMAAAMMEAFRENKYRDAGIGLPKGRSRSRIGAHTAPRNARSLRLKAYKAQRRANRQRRKLEAR